MTTGESWIIKKVEPRRADAFELWYWRRLLRVLWTARRANFGNSKGNQPRILIGRADAETEAPKLGHLMQRADSLEKTLQLGKIEGKRRRERQRMRWLDSIADSNRHELEQTLGDRGGQGRLAVHGFVKNWT